MTKYTNFARTALNGAVSTTDVTINVIDGSDLPTEDFYIVIDGGNASREIILVKSRTLNALTTSLANRGLHGTEINEHLDGAHVTHGPLAHEFEEALKATQIFIPGRPQGTLKRSYTFDSSVEGWTSATGTVSNASGSLRFQGSAAGNSQALEPVGAADVADGEIWCDISSNYSDSDLGIIFRGTDEDNHYVVAIRGGWNTSNSASSETVQLYKKVGGTYTSLSSQQTTSASIKGPDLGANVPARVLIRFVGPQISVYIDDALTIKVYDSSLTTGRFGVRVGDNPYYLELDNVSIYSLPADWKPTWSGGKLARPVPTGVTFRQNTGDSATVVTNNSTDTDLGVDVTFTLDEPKIVSIYGATQVKTNVSGATAGYLKLKIDGVNQSNGYRWHNEGLVRVLYPAVQKMILLGAGEHTVELIGNVDSGSGGTADHNYRRLWVDVLDPYDVEVGDRSLTGSAAVDSVTDTSGDKTLSSATWADVPGVLEVTVPAKAGDTLELDLSAQWSPTTPFSFLDAQTIANGAVVSSVASRGALDQTSEGIEAWGAPQNVNAHVGGSITYTATASDISNGKITFRLRYRQSAASNRILYCRTTNPLFFGVKNLSRITIDGIESSLPDAETVSVRASGNGQNIPDVTWTDLVFDGVDHDTHAMWDGASTLTIPSDGIYRIAPTLGWVANGTGARYLAIAKNGTRLFNYSYPGSAGAHPYNGYSDTLTLLAGDEIKMQAYSDAGASTTTQGFFLSISKVESVLPNYEESYSILPKWKGFDIDAPKAWADYVDDEFDSAALASKWTVASGAAGKVNTTATVASPVYDLTSMPGTLLMQAGGGQVTVRQDHTVPDGSSIILCLSPASTLDGTTDIDECGTAIRINNDDTGGSAGEWWYVTFAVKASNAWTVEAWDGTTLHTYNNISDPNSKFYVKFTRKGSVYHLFISQDGVTWTRMGSRTFTAIPNNIWLDTYNTSAVPAYSAFHWIRQGSDSPVPWQTKPDAGVTIKGVSIRDRLYLPDQDNPLGLDDEFDDDKIDPAWIKVVGTTDKLHSISESADSLNIKISGTNTQAYDLQGLFKPLGGATFPLYVEAAFNTFGINSSGGAYAIGGIALSDGVVHASSKSVSAASWVTTTSSLLSFRSMSTFTGTGAAVLQEGPGNFTTGNKTFVRIAWTSENQFAAWWSPNGILWTRVGDAGSYAFTMTPTHIGIIGEGWYHNADNRIIVSCDYIRVRKGLPS